MKSKHISYGGLLCCLLLFSWSLAAKEATPVADDLAIELRLNTIAEEMRCLVCQNESLAGSRADLAIDLRRELREQIKAGKTDAEIRNFMVSRYGDFVLYRPPLTLATGLLWLGPFALALFGLVALIIFLRRRRKDSPLVPISAAEQERARQLLEKNAP